MHDKDVKMIDLYDTLQGTEDTESPPISAGKPASSDALNNNYPIRRSIGADNPRGLTGQNTK